MTTTTPSLVRRTFRIIVDIETTVMASPRERLGDGKTHERYYQALVQHLLAHPPALRDLLRASAVEALLEAKTLLEAEYGWGKTSDQQVLQPISAELEPAAQAYFIEELEDGRLSITSTAALHLSGFVITDNQVGTDEDQRM